MQRLLSALKRPEALQTVQQVARSIEQAEMQPGTARVALADVIATLGLPRANWPEAAQALIHALIEKLPAEERGTIRASIGRVVDDQSLLASLEDLLRGIPFAITGLCCPELEVRLNPTQSIRALEQVQQVLTAGVFQQLLGSPGKTQDPLPGASTIPIVTADGHASRTGNVRPLPVDLHVPEAQSAYLPSHWRMASLLNDALTRDEESMPRIDVQEWDLFASSVPEGQHDLMPLQTFARTQSGMSSLACTDVACRWKSGAFSIRKKATLEMAPQLRANLDASTAVGLRTGSEPPKMWVVQQTQSGWVGLNCDVPGAQGEALKAWTLTGAIEAMLNKSNIVSRPASVQLLHLAPSPAIRLPATAVSEQETLERKRGDNTLPTEPSFKKQEPAAGASETLSSKPQPPPTSEPSGGGPKRSYQEGDSNAMLFQADALTTNPSDVQSAIERVLSDVRRNTDHAMSELTRQIEQGGMHPDIACVVLADVLAGVWDVDAQRLRSSAERRLIDALLRQLPSAQREPSAGVAGLRWVGEKARFDVLQCLLQSASRSQSGIYRIDANLYSTQLTRRLCKGLLGAGHVEIDIQGDVQALSVALAGDRIELSRDESGSDRYIVSYKVATPEIPEEEMPVEVEDAVKDDEADEKGSVAQAFDYLSDDEPRADSI